MRKVLPIAYPSVVLSWLEKAVVVTAFQGKTPYTGGSVLHHMQDSSGLLLQYCSSSSNRGLFCIKD